MRIAPLTAADAPAYRELMLEAYALAADAFTSTAEERAAEPLAWWEKRIAGADGLSQSFGAFDERGQGGAPGAAPLVGTVALEYSRKPKTQHSALVLGMYVRAQARRLGAGRALMNAAIAAARARPGIQVLRLTLTEGNAQASALYESVGFSAWGTEPRAILTPGGLRGKVHMWMGLTGR